MALNKVLSGIETKQEAVSMLSASLDAATVLISILIMMKASHQRIMIVGHSLMATCTALIALFFLLIIIMVFL